MPALRPLGLGPGKRRKGKHAVNIKVDGLKDLAGAFRRATSEMRGAAAGNAEREDDHEDDDDEEEHQEDQDGDSMIDPSEHKEDIDL